MPEPTNSELLTAISGVAAAVGQMDTRLTSAVGELDTRLTAAFSGLEARVSGLDARVSELDARVGDLASRVGGLASRMERVEAAVDRNGEAIGSVRTDTMDRMDRMLEQLRSEMTVNWATADIAIRHGRDRQDELRGLYDMIGGLQRQYRLLAVRVDDLSQPKH